MAQGQKSSEVRDRKLEKVQNLIDEGNSPYLAEKYDVDTYTNAIVDNFDEMEGKTVSVAGRVISKRRHGKIAFLDILDTYGQVQIFAKKNNLEEEYEVIKGVDVGDFLGVKGEVIRTQAGAISVEAKAVQLLSKSIQVLPEKFHGLKDMDLRYRQRYVDLIVNPEVKEVFFKRSAIIKAVRKFLDARGFLEVETPILGNVAGGANARPFLTHHNALDIDLQMRIANELFLKRLIVGGFDKVYEMGKMFRNEGMDARHNPEFTNMELYQAYVDMDEMMRITEELVAFCAEEVLGSAVIEYQGKTLDLTPPWKRIRMQDAVKEYSGVDFDAIETDEEALAVAKEKGLEVQPFWTRGHVISEMFEEYCEEHMVQPTFITGHPVEVSPLAKRDPEDPRITRRFEAFINTWEIANAFSELNDPIDQRERFEEQVKDQEKGDDEAHPMDYDFINAIEVGMPPTGGLGVGIDRVIMLLTDQTSIRDILFFPTMKPLEGQDVESWDEESEEE
ncbi:Lysine--tRNA ligase [Aedoeadaptatus ivorii]|uniref:Lysine--tRNA ligase n=1 Tax=Aedoeadaptatus ivorii TaxID=54006 RepID=A0A448V2Y0_9FIRM|nr:lysine--tRNA ligase [Peptoniphilus ivorii]MDQ0508741.1 lysyl-tRNA synthetase class 2 [Peptoniphilus ivorii]VEJ36132.1 Lysine--tRNA ligase [Peptoniphilus ivorii]